MEQEKRYVAVVEFYVWAKTYEDAIEQVKKQIPYLQKTLRLQLNVVGIANSKKLLINVTAAANTTHGQHTDEAN